MEEYHLNVALLRSRVPNLTVASRKAGLRPATVSNLCTGKIPIGRAEVRTLAQLASLAGCTMDELIVRGNPISMIETGIKMVDLLAPVVKGGITGFVARPGTGQMVLMAEIMHRLKLKNYAVIFWKPEVAVVGIDEIVKESDCVCTHADEVYERILEFGPEREIILGADRAVVLSGEMSELEEKLRGTTGLKPITTMLVDISGDAVDEDTPFGPLDTFLRFDPELTTRGLFPALDPVVSTSIILEGAELEPAHLQIQQQTRKLLRRYRELRPLVEFRGIEKRSDSEKMTYMRGERMEAFLSQPFYLAEPYTKKKAEWISLQATLEDARTILDGGADLIASDLLFFTGRLKKNT